MTVDDIILKKSKFYVWATIDDADHPGKRKDVKEERNGYSFDLEGHLFHVHTTIPGASSSGFTVTDAATGMAIFSRSKRKDVLQKLIDELEGILSLFQREKKHWEELREQFEGLEAKI